MIAPTISSTGVIAQGSAPGLPAPSGFGEAWNATQTQPSDPPPAPPTSPQPAAAQQANTASQASPESNTAKPTAKRSKAATSSELKTEQASAAPTTAPASDLAALQSLIAAITGQPAGTPTVGAASTQIPTALKAPGGDDRPTIELTGGKDVISGDIIDGAALAFTLDLGQAAATASPADAIAAPSTDLAATAPDQAVVRQLDLAGDGAWLDQLTRDIARTADSSGQLRFALAPEHLGRLEVQIAAGADGTAIRLTTETRDAHRIITDAQPQLVAEARAQGLRISEAQVDLNNNGGSGAGHQAFGNQNSGGRPQPQPLIPIVETPATPVAPPIETTAADALYA